MSPTTAPPLRASKPIRARGDYSVAAGDPEDEMEEEWRAVVGWPHYEVSSHGRVRSWRRGGGTISPDPTIMQNGFTCGYPTVHLSDRGRSQILRVHHLVLTAFIGPRPLGLEAAHRDGKRANNHIANLRWATHSENEADKRKHGTAQVGARNGGSKLSDHFILKLRQEHAAGARCVEIGRRYGMSSSRAWTCLHGSWRHLPFDKCCCPRIKRKVVSNG